MLPESCNFVSLHFDNHVKTEYIFSNKHKKSKFYLQQQNILHN